VSDKARFRKPVGALEVAAFSLPAGPLLALTLPTVIFLPPYFVTHLGLPQWLAASIFLFARAFDLLLDPALGSMQDRTQSRFGRRRIWLVATCPLLMALVWVVFIGLEPGASDVAAAVSVFALYVVFAAMMVAHLGWSGELIPTYHGRTHVLGAVQASSLFGEIILLVLAAYVVQALHGSDADAVHAMGWTLIVMLPVTTAIAVLLARENKVPPQPHMSLGDALKTVFSNRLARRVLAPDLLLGVAQGLSGGLFLFYFQFVLGFVRESQTLVAIYFAAGFIGVPIWWALARRIGKHKALQAALVYSALTTLLLLVTPSGNFPIAIVFMIIAGLAQGGGILLTRSLMADVVDDDELRTGSRRSGVYFGLLLMTSKLGLAAGPAAFGLLQVFGFDASLGADNTPLAQGALSAFFIGGPILMFLSAAATLKNYPLDEKAQAALAAAIDARHSANSENILGPSTK
jgi:GPH family glycoside/pentoside/hexuronide:cation symporter